MSLLHFAQELGISPKRIASTCGGEYHSPCPKCGGKDRFIIWKETGRYWCRQCDLKGDSIQFCRDFFGCVQSECCFK
ncbi:MAG: primase-helicase zinc-binding domain-containing protein [Chlamydiota bacterium]